MRRDGGSARIRGGETARGGVAIILVSGALTLGTASAAPATAVPATAVPATAVPARALAATAPRPHQPVSSVATGSEFTCAVTTAGTVKCWGDNRQGQLGDGTTTSRRRPVSVVGLSGFGRVVEVAAGRAHVCALTLVGQVICWGAVPGNATGRTTAAPGRPVPVIGLNDVTSIRAGSLHTCALTATGAVKCWGYNHNGQLGDQTPLDSFTTPVQVYGLEKGVSAISLGADFSCALTTAGAVKCWGDNDSHQLGRDASGSARWRPGQVGGLTSGVSAVSAGAYHACALVAGSAKCWGDNFSGELGDGTTIQRTTPVDVVGLTGTVDAISAGTVRTCAITADGPARCWGDNQYGGLGTGETHSSLVPAQVYGPLSNVVQLTGSFGHTCAIQRPGPLTCWGLNEVGQIGDGTFIDRLRPARVYGLTG
jgi:alpha-tubulin suppressor-like RCC1 family protein